MVAQLVQEVSDEVQELERWIQELERDSADMYDKMRALKGECDAHVATFLRLQQILADLDHAQAMGYVDRVDDAITRIVATIDTHCNDWSSLSA